MAHLVNFKQFCSICNELEFEIINGNMHKFI